MAVFCWLWFQEDENQPNTREHIIAIIISSFAAIASARALALLLPFRLRPQHEMGLSFRLPLGQDPAVLSGWSSFPSDHAVLFVALAVGLFFISRKIGLSALLYTIIFIALPRMYLGLHYPTDILAGGLIGLVIGWLMNRKIVLNAVSKPILQWSRRHPGLFYTLLFLTFFQIAELFGSSRSLLNGAYHMIRYIL